ncbi:hypothetical protein C8R47DRAFT_1324788 [Mycena vitilis]|nr:hypothetical protein C8R47DRAFT_1326031 [Mycena vitilis]KAJ6472172.1 hypothetical protein C8R47DRAFT_1324788 [Mycena vitilis]
MIMGYRASSPSTLDIDVRSPNMHLALRTAEIMACAESMWEYRASARARGGGGQDPLRASCRLGHIAIGSTLRDRFSWPCVPAAPSQDRKVFHAACERWERW